MCENGAMKHFARGLKQLMACAVSATIASTICGAQVTWV